MSAPILYTIDAGTSTGYRPATLDEIMASARHALNRRVRKGTALTSPQLTRDYLTAKLGTREFETFCCLFLDNRHRVIDFVELFRGTIDGASCRGPYQNLGVRCHKPDNSGAGDVRRNLGYRSRDSVSSVPSSTAQRT